MHSQGALPEGRSEKPAEAGYWSLADFFNILAQAIGDFKK
jgi:hypothetical protein